MLVVVLSLLELASGDFVKDPTAQVLLVNLRDAVGLLDEFHTLGLVLIAAYGVRLGFHQVQLVAGEHVDGSDALFFVLEKMALLVTAVEGILGQGFTQQL